MNTIGIDKLITIMKVYTLHPDETKENRKLARVSFKLDDNYSLYNPNDYSPTVSPFLFLSITVAPLQGILRKWVQKAAREERER